MPDYASRVSTLPPQRRRVYDFIMAEHGAGRGFPAMRAIRDHMGWKVTPSARDAVYNLAVFDKVLGWEHQGFGKWRFWVKHEPETATARDGQAPAPVVRRGA